MAKEVHPVQGEAAIKGKLREDRLTKKYKDKGWIVSDHKVNENGVDLIAYKKFTPENEEAYQVNNEYHEELIFIFEITNWKKELWMNHTTAKRYISNLEAEEINQRVLHPKAHIEKFIVLSYWDNIRKIENILFKENINYEVIGFQELPPELEGWKETNP